MSKNNLTKNAERILHKRYLIKNEDGEIVETPSEMFERVASEIAKVNEEYDDDRTMEEEKNEFKNALSNLEFLPNSPTLMNAGTEIGQLSACFVLSPDDDMDSIFHQVKNAAKIFQSGGGVGYSFSDLRPDGDVVKSTGGVASGPISFMRVYDEACNTVKQGGRRRGAQMGVLSVQHPDIESFIEAKDEENALNNFNLSVGLTEEFMDAVQNGEDYDLINPRNGEVAGQKDSQKIFDKIIDQAWKNGEPGIVFLDRINEDNPFDLDQHPEHKIQATNPCVTGDTRVYTEGGLKRIDELVEQQQASLLMDSRECKEKTQPTVEIMKTGIKEVCKLKTEEGYSIKVTKDHQIKTPDGWVEAQNLSEGDKIHIFDRGKAFGNCGDKFDGITFAARTLLDDADFSPMIFKGSKELQEKYLSIVLKKYGKINEEEKEDTLYIEMDSIDTLKNIQQLLLNFRVYSKLNQEDNELVVYESLTHLLANIELPDFAYRKLSLEEKTIPEFTATFKGLEDRGKEEVYDLREPRTHSFVGEGIVVHNCGEQPLEDYEACNLGHINLGKCVKDNKVDWEKLEDLTDMAVRFLDNVIDASEFPNIKSTDGTEDAIRKKVEANRKIGLGVMGWHHMLMKLEIPYDSEEAIEKANEVMEVISEKSKEVSNRIAEKRGNFPNWDESEYERPMRNATTTTIAPTGTTSMIANASGGIEPVFALSYIKNVLGGEQLVMPDPVFEEYAKDHGFYDEEYMESLTKQGSIAEDERVPDKLKPVFKTAMEIKPEWHLRMQAAFQEHVDNAISKTVNFPNDATKEDVKEVYELAYKLGCKGVTVYRSGSRSEQVMETEEEKEENEELATARPRDRPKNMNGNTQKVSTGYGNIYVTINEDKHGLFEVFAQIGRSGGFTQSFTEGLTRLASLCLRSGIPPEEVINQLEGIRSPKPVYDKKTEIKSIPDAVAKAMKWHLNGNIEIEQTRLPEAENGSKKDNPGHTNLETENTQNPNQSDVKEIVKKGMNPTCPECGEFMVLSEGCISCPSCGKSEC